MRHALGKEKWQDLMPDVFAWLGRVKLTAADEAPPKAHQVIGVEVPQSEQDQPILVGRGLSDDLKRQLLNASAALGWNSIAGCIHLKVAEQTFTLVPLSSVKTSSVQKARQLGLDIAKALKAIDHQHIALWGGEDLPLQGIFDGFAQGLYDLKGFKGKRPKEPGTYPNEVTLVGEQVSEDSVKRTLVMSEAQIFSRFLQDGPSNYIDPVKLGEIAEQMGKDYGGKVKVMGRSDLEKLGMGSFLSVADGGHSEPRLIVFEFEGDNNEQTVALVGKGLTFDAGGISIKPSQGMEDMKYDMSGGAAVFGAAHFFGKVKPPVRVVCLIGAAENLPSGTATRPGDIVRAMNGKTIEVHNTDAEGRLVLADVLHYASTEYQPDLMLDAATLTGAVLQALGGNGCAILTPDEQVADYVRSAGLAVGEPSWHLPMWPELDKEVKGDLGDLKNIAKGNVKAGTIIGGVFLKEFVGTTKWAHLDIAATAWNCQATGYPTTGGSGFGVRMMVNACERYGK